MTGSNDANDTAALPMRVVQKIVTSSGVPPKSESQIVRNPLGDGDTPSSSSETDSSESGNLPDRLVQKMESKSKRATSVVRNPLAP